MHMHLLVGAVGLAASVLFMATVSATVVVYDVSQAFGGAQSGGTAPFVRLAFDDAAAPGAVRLTASAPGLDVTEWVARIHLNLDPAFDASQLTFGNFEILSGTMLQPVAVRGRDVAEADGGGLFDVEFQFAVSGGGFARRFNQGEAFRMDLGGIPELNANSFNFLSALPAANGQQLLSVQIQGIGPEGLEGHHTVPELTTAGAALTAVGGLVLGRRRT